MGPSDAGREGRAVVQSGGSHTAPSRRNWRFFLARDRHHNILSHPPAGLGRDQHRAGRKLGLLAERVGLQTNLLGIDSPAVRRPGGLVERFSPWSGTNIMSWHAVLPPIVGGNTVVVRPSEIAPVSAGLIVAQIAEEAGFPPGVINVVTHGPEEAGLVADEISDNPAVRVVSLIGGNLVGILSTA